MKPRVGYLKRKTRFMSFQPNSLSEKQRGPKYIKPDIKEEK